MKRRSAALVGLVAVLAATGQAQNGFLHLFPELRQLPAPAWLAEGDRLTFSAAAAGIGFETETPVGGGAGFTTVDVVAVDRKNAVLEVTSWGNLQGAGVIVLTKNGLVGLPSAGGEFWLHPDVLRNATAKAGENLKVVRMQAPAHGKTYEVIRFQDEAEDHLYVWQFDTATGILVSAGSRVGPEDGERTQTDMQFISRRRINVPWLNQAPPAWIATVRGFAFQGSLSTTVPGSPPMGGRPLQGTATVKQRGSRWLQCDVTSTFQSPQGLPPTTTQATLISGIAQVGGFWLPPAGLRVLQPGQVLDQDPTVGARQVVTGADGQWVTIGYGTPVDSTEFLYEVTSGQLVRFRRTQQMGVATQVLDVTVQRQ
jgi:hypothetical protein